MAIPTGADYLCRLLLLPAIIKKYQETKDERYLNKAAQICIDNKVNVKKFKKILSRKIEELRESKKAIKDAKV